DVLVVGNAVIVAIAGLGRHKCGKVDRTPAGAEVPADYSDGRRTVWQRSVTARSDIKPHIGAAVLRVEQILDAAKATLAGSVRRQSTLRDDLLLGNCKGAGEYRAGEACANRARRQASIVIEIIGAGGTGCVKRHVWNQPMVDGRGHVAPMLPRW